MSHPAGFPKSSFAVAAHSRFLAAIRGCLPARLNASWEQSRATLQPVIDAPGRIGWRSLTELHEWSTAKALDKTEVTKDAYDAMITGRLDCAKNVRIAGPFGRNTPAERRRPFETEHAP